MISRNWWVINMYIWTFCCIGNFWIAYILNSALPFAVSLGCGVVAYACSWIVQDSE